MYFRLTPGLTLAVSLFCLFLTVTLARPDPSGESSDPSDDPSRPCLHYEGDGCSIPFGLPFFYKRQFTKSCDRHDVCYHCGQAYNISRPQCDHAFRRNTLATCKAEYLAPTSRLPAEGQVYSVDSADIPSHQQHFLKIVEEYGMNSLEIIIETEISSLVKVHPVPSFHQFQAWFSRREVRVRMLAEWVKDLAEYVEQHAVEHFLPYQNVKDSIGSDWCMDVDKYLHDHNETIPSSSGIVCPDIEYLTCNIFSEVYFLAVRLFANSSYRRPAEFYCHESWVPKCLPHPPSTVLRFIPHEISLDGTL